MAELRSKCYKWCFVPGCKNTTTSTPNKIFVTVPRNEQVRRKWAIKARRDDAMKMPTCMLFCCEDHFTLEEDMENWMRYKLMGGKIKMKAGILPRKFDCQLTRTTASNAKKQRRAFKKKKRLSTCAAHQEIAHSSGMQSEEQLHVINIKAEPTLETQSNEDLLIPVIKTEPEDDDLTYHMWSEDAEFAMNVYDQFEVEFRCENCSTVFKHEQTYKEHLKLASCISEMALDALYVADSENSGSCNTHSIQIGKIKVEFGVSGPQSNEIFESEPAGEALSSAPPAIKQERSDESKAKNLNGEMKSDESKSSGVPEIESSDEFDSEPSQSPILNEIHVTLMCNMCGRSFESNYKLVFHIYEEHGLPVECEQCATVCRAMRVLLEHVTLKHRIKMHMICGECDEKFEERKGLLKHLKRMHKRYMCNICTEILISNRGLKKHKWLEHGKKNKCKLCNRSFKSEAWYLMHIEKKHKTKCCDKCGKAFHTPLALWTHLSKVHGLKMAYLCTVCGAGCETRGGLASHIRCTHATEFFFCKKCGRRFMTQNLLSEHEKRAHIQIIQCSVCINKFTSVKKLLKHMKSRHKGKSFLCKKCGKGYESKNCFFSHLRAHRQKPYNCTKCNASFKFKEDFVRHESIHKEMNDMELCKHCRMGFLKSVGKCKFCAVCEKKNSSKKPRGIRRRRKARKAAKLDHNLDANNDSMHG